MRNKSDILSYIAAKYLYELKMIEVLASKEQTNSTKSNPQDELSFFSLANTTPLTELLESLQKLYEKKQDLDLDPNLDLNLNLTTETNEAETLNVNTAKPSAEDAKRLLQLIRKKPDLAGKYGEGLLYFLESLSASQHEAILEIFSNNNLSHEQLQSEVLLIATREEENLTTEKLQDTLSHIQNSNFLSFYKDLTLQPKLENTESNLENTQQDESHINKSPTSSINEEINNTITEIQNDLSQAQNTNIQPINQSQNITLENTSTTISPRPTAAPAA
jgi:hypothetical protein